MIFAVFLIQGGANMSLDIIVIMLLVAFILGLIVGVLLSRPNFVR